MKFAVVEYTSKSGSIWRHTPAKPNYLADPDREIDPTSFGCYVSALAGEHIPLKGLVTGSVIPLSPVTIFTRRLYRKLFGHWPKNYSLEYFKQFDVLMAVHQISDGHEITTLVKRLKKELPHIFIIGVPTQPYGLLKHHWENNSGWLKDFQDFMNTCDVFATLTNSTKEQWATMTTTPVVYLPQPYPFEYAFQFFKPLPQKHPIIFVAGVTDRPDIKRGQAVAKQLQEKHPEYKIHITETPGHSQDTANLANVSYELQPFLPWQQQLQYLAEVKLVINTDYTQTRGRVQVDCAAIGTPSLGADSDGQTDLFPDLPSTEKTTVQELVNQAEQLLTNPSWYEEVVTKAKDRLPHLSYPQSRQRIEELVKQYKKA